MDSRNNVSRGTTIRRKATRPTRVGYSEVRSTGATVYPCGLARLQGIFVPLLVPLDERGQINELELRRFVSWLIERGVHGLYPNGSTGEFTRFTPEERRRIVEVVEIGRAHV